MDIWLFYKKMNQLFEIIINILKNLVSTTSRTADSLSGVYTFTHVKQQEIVCRLCQSCSHLLEILLLVWGGDVGGGTWVESAVDRICHKKLGAEITVFVYSILKNKKTCFLPFLELVFNSF